MNSQRKPAMNIGPGEFIKEELEFRHWRQEDLAAVLGMAPKTVNEIIKSKQAITIETARLLGKVFGQSPQYWLNLDANYRLRLRQNTARMKEVGTRSEIYSRMPIKEMVGKGWLKAAVTAHALSEEIKAYWKIPTLDLVFMDNRELHVFRKSEAYPNFNPFFAQTWYRMAQRCARMYEVGPYKADALRSLARKLPAYSSKPGGVEGFIEGLNQAGVKFFVLHHLSKTYIDGASFRDGNNPVVVYTCRYDRVDHFWFTMAHEIAHILNHIHKADDHFIDIMERRGTNAEDEADSFAAAWVMAQDILGFFKGSVYISTRQVEICAERFAIHPALVVGILQHHGRLSRTNLNRFKTKVSTQIPNAFWVEKRLEDIGEAS